MNQGDELKRITVGSILSEAWHTLTHAEVGLRRTTVALVITPGRMLQKYLEGERKQYQKPFSFLLIATTLFALVLYFNHQRYLIPIATGFDDRVFNNQVLLETKYYAWFQIVCLPVYGLVAFMIFRNLKYNYAEWLVICCYVLGLVLLIQIPFHFLLTYLHLNDSLHKGIQLLVSEAYTLYALNDFLKHKMNWLRFVYIILVVVINFFIFMSALRGMAYLMTW